MEMLIFVAFGVLALGTYGDAVRLRWHSWRQYRDARARDTLIVGAALFVASIAGVSSIAATILNWPIEVRGALAGLASGCFAAAGWAFRDASRGHPPRGKR